MENNEIIEFGIGDMMGIAMTLGVMAIGAAYILNVLTDVRGEFTSGTVEYNATQSAITGVSKLPSKLPLIATIVIAAIVISILVRYLWVKSTV